MGRRRRDAERRAEAPAPSHRRASWSIGAGLLGSVIGVFGWIVIQILPLAITLASLRRSGSGGIGAVSVGLWPGPAIAAVVGFVLGFWWHRRRQSR